MLGMLTNRELYPNMNKISILGHSAGGQMVQRYSLMSLLAAAYDVEEVDWIDMQFIVANPSSYTYLFVESVRATRTIAPVHNHVRMQAKAWLYHFEIMMIEIPGHVSTPATTTGHTASVKLPTHPTWYRT
jgi:hypothetical protein